MKPATPQIRTSSPRIPRPSAFQTYLRVVYAVMDDASVELQRVEFAELIALVAERSRRVYGVDWGIAA
jgi:hypothetical protein